jgi:hypothetical protein
MGTPDLQVKLFQFIKSRIKDSVNPAEEIAALLDISTDSAYRRIRGEKQLSFEELTTLCSTYKISLDQVLDIQTGSFQFAGNLIDEKNHRYNDYLKEMMHTMAYFASTEKKEFYFLSKDIPIFYHWQSRELACFKYFFWMSILVYFPEFRNKKVDMSAYADDIWNTGQQIMEYYNTMDSFEVWNLESFSSTLHQIDYFREGNRFDSDKDILKVYEGVQGLLDHLEEQAVLGYKFKWNDPEKKPMGKYHMYINDILILENTMFIKQDHSKMVVMPHSGFNYMMSRDIRFCDNLDHYIQNLLSRSTLVSETSEKERSRFFRILRERIDRRKEKLKL